MFEKGQHNNNKKTGLCDDDDENSEFEFEREIDFFCLNFFSKSKKTMRDEDEMKIDPLKIGTEFWNGDDDDDEIGPVVSFFPPFFPPKINRMSRVVVVVVVFSFGKCCCCCCLLIRHGCLLERSIGGRRK